MLHGHHFLYVVLSIVIAILGSWTALDLHRRIASHRGLPRIGWLGAAALAASLSIWSMHFVAMLGFNAGVPVRYDFGLTIASLLLAVVPTAAAFFAIERPAPSARRILVAGLAMGTGICLMHYVGMAAVRAPATLSYRPALVVLSFLIAVGASWAALQAALWRPSQGLRAVGAVVLGIAIASMHYTAMAGATFTPTHAARIGAGDFDNLTLALGVASSTLLLLFLALLAAMFDRRFEIFALKEAQAAARAESEARLRELNDTLAQRVAHAVAEREAAQAQLHEVQKLETIGQLTGGVAHDINNLLTPIVASLDLLQRRVAGDERAQRQIAGALQAADRARVLVQRLLAFARRQTLAAQAVDLAALVDGLTDLIGRSLGPHIEVAVDLPGGLPAAKVDPHQLELALLNLAVNARDAMPGGGRLTLSAREVDVGEGGQGTLSQGRYVVLAVKDTGVGMDSDTLRRAVEPFFTTKGVGRGTGLGLSMVHGLAAQSGGMLHLASTPGQGTCAELWLPVANEAVASQEAEEGPLLHAPRPATILLVDDEELVRAGTADMLSELGYTVIQAASGAEAVEMLRTGLEVELVITDYAMPTMTGVEVARSVRSHRPETPVLLITGYANLSEGETAHLPRLAKPFRQVDLSAAVAGLLRSNVIRLPERSGT